MIVSRRPLLFDVDLIALALLACLAAAAGALLLRPLHHARLQHAALVERMSTARAAHQTAGMQARQLRAQAAQLQSVVNQIEQRASRIDGMPALLSLISQTATRHGIEVMSVRPEAARLGEAAALHADVQLSLRGTSLQLLAFLDELGRQQPLQELRALTLDGSVEGEGLAAAQLSLRLHMLPPDPLEGQGS